MISSKALRRAAGKLRTLGIGQDGTISASLNELADGYEYDADALDAAAAEVASIAALRGRPH
jgi:hypothetical protein